MTTEQRFWSKVQKTSSCWYWLDKPNSDGYGQFAVASHKAPIKAHRLAWELTRGTVPHRTLVNTCGCKTCVNPDHWQPRTRKPRGTYNTDGGISIKFDWAKIAANIERIVARELAFDNRSHFRDYRTGEMVRGTKV